jgi:hypothetical protein
LSGPSPEGTRKPHGRLHVESALRPAHLSTRENGPRFEGNVHGQGRPDRVDSRSHAGSSARPIFTLDPGEGLRFDRPIAGSDIQTTWPGKHAERPRGRSHPSTPPFPHGSRQSTQPIVPGSRFGSGSGRASRAKWGTGNRLRVQDGWRGSVRRGRACGLAHKRGPRQSTQPVVPGSGFGS